VALAVVGTAFVVAAAVVTGCSSTTPSPGASGAAPAEATTLAVQVESTWVPYIQPVAAAFESQNPGVKVSMQTITDQQKITTNGQVLAANGAPDVGIAATNAQAYVDLVKANAVVDLSDVWSAQDLQNRYGAAVADSLKWNGKPYVVLMDKSIYNIVLYNKDAFAAAGIAEPTDHQIASTADLYSIVTALKAKGYEGVSIGGNAGYKWGWLVDGQLYQNLYKGGDEAAFTDLTTSWRSGAKQTVPYNGPKFLDSIAQIKDWYDHNVFQNGALGQSDDQSQAAFTSGKAAMLLGGNWTFAVVDKEKPSFTYDWLLLPGAAAGNPTVPTIYAGDTFVVPVKAAHPDLAKKFLQLLVTDEMQTAMAKAGAVPAVTTVDPTAVSGAQQQAILTFIQKKGGGAGWTSILPGALGQTFIDQQVQKLLGGQESLEQLGQNQQKQFDTWKSQNG